MSKPNLVLRQAIRDGYKEGLTPQEIADRAGSTAGSVKVLAYRMGVNDTPLLAALKRRQRQLSRANPAHGGVDD